MNEQLVAEITKDCQILLDRALLGRDIVCFGMDGNGQYGYTDTPQTYKVAIIETEIADLDSPIAACFVLHLENYSARKFGHIQTDENFKISLNKLFAAHSIATDSWGWADISVQEDTAVVLKLNVENLLDWS